MKFRAFCFGLLALVSLTPGCLPYRHHPCWGFRLHPCSTGGQCESACSSHIGHHRPPAVISDCAGCIGGGAMMHQPVAYPATAFQSYPYPPVIGKPIPIPGPTVIPSQELPNPMPVKPGGQ